EEARELRLDDKCLDGEVESAALVQGRESCGYLGRREQPLSGAQSAVVAEHADEVRGCVVGFGLCANVDVFHGSLELGSHIGTRPRVRRTYRLFGNLDRADRFFYGTGS